MTKTDFLQKIQFIYNWYTPEHAEVLLVDSQYDMQEGREVSAKATLRLIQTYNRRWHVVSNIIKNLINRGEWENGRTI